MPLLQSFWAIIRELVSHPQTRYAREHKDIPDPRHDKVSAEDSLLAVRSTVQSASSVFIRK